MSIFGKNYDSEIKELYLRMAAFAKVLEAGAECAKSHRIQIDSLEKRIEQLEKSNNAQSNDR